MSQNYTSFYIALRYLKGRKSGFLSFISALAFISTSLGVAVLIIVSSVMNGFEKELKDRVSMIWEIETDQIKFENGNFSSKTDSELSINIRDLARKLDGTGGPVSAVGSVDLDSSTHGFGTHVVDLEIDPETGKTDVIKYTAVQDVGKAIHPSYVEGLSLIHI